LKYFSTCEYWTKSRKRIEILCSVVRCATPVTERQA